MKYQRVVAIDKDTGEVLGNVLLTESEELILDKENKKQMEAIKRKLKLNKDMQDFIQANEGGYFHLIYKYCYPLMLELTEKYEGNKANIHIIRFMILASYSTFGGTLRDKNNNRIKKSTLGKIWDTQNRNGIKETYDILTECNYIYKTEEGYLMVNEDLVIKGGMEKFLKENKDITYTRVFTTNIQDMYYNTEAKKRPQLANLFKVLPFVNFKYNVFCSNPTETNEEDLQLLTWTDLARLCGYEDKKNIAKFKKDLWNLEIYGYSTIGEFRNKAGMAICINPKIYYSGNDINDVKNLYVMFTMCDGKK